MTSALVLRRLDSRDERAFLRAIELTRESDPNFARYYDPQRSFSDYLAALEKAKLGVDLPPDHVPSATLFGFVDGSVVSLG